MWLVAALAFMTLVVAASGSIALVVAIMPEATQDLALGAALLYGAALFGLVLVVPLSFYAAHRRLAGRDQRLTRG